MGYIIQGIAGITCVFCAVQIGIAGIALFMDRRKKAKIGDMIVYACMSLMIVSAGVWLIYNGYLTRQKHISRMEQIVITEQESGRDGPHHQTHP